MWVVTLGSFRGAAQKLNATQAAISQRSACCGSASPDGPIVRGRQAPDVPFGVKSSGPYDHGATSDSPGKADVTTA
jgi:hypothetical protein